MGAISIKQMRKELAEAPDYASSVSWRIKVNTWPNRQVAAVYKKFKKSGRLKEKKKGVQIPYQITIWDILEQQKTNN